MNLIFTISVKSELTGKSGTKTISVGPNPTNMLEKFYEAIRECLFQIANSNKKGIDN